MFSRIATALAAAAALAGGVAAASAPAEAQGFSITIGSGHPAPHYRAVGGPYGGWGAPPPHAYGPRHFYGHPGWGHGGGYYRRCWRQPVDVWTGWGYERRWQKFCR
jgi:hypothetical protein